MTLSTSRTRSLVIVYSRALCSWQSSTWQREHPVSLQDSLGCQDLLWISTEASRRRGVWIDEGMSTILLLGLCILALTSSCIIYRIRQRPISNEHSAFLEQFVDSTTSWLAMKSLAISRKDLRPRRQMP